MWIGKIYPPPPLPRLYYIYNILLYFRRVRNGALNIPHLLYLREFSVYIVLVFLSLSPF